MKIEKLTENKVRIIINLDELSEQNMDIKTLIKNNEQSHILFENMLKEAEKRVGFTVQNCKLLIEAFSTSEGFLVFTLTKYKNEQSRKTNSEEAKIQKENI